MGFDSVFGNDAEKQRLIKSITEDTLPHALMIVADRGSGKKTLALEIAMALNCDRRKERSANIPCYRCNRCRRIREGKFTDVKFLRPREDRSTIGVEEVRTFKEDMYLSPTESEYKIYVFEDADTLTVQAQNALLIALEEPFSNVISILLVSSYDKMLSTIKSRTRQIAMERFSAERLLEYFEKNDENAISIYKNEPERLNGILMSAMGSIGVAKELLNTKNSAENEQKRDTVIKILSSLGTKGGYVELYRTISELPKNRSELKPIFEDVILSVRDLTAIKRDGTVRLLFFTNREHAAELSRKFNQKRLLAIYDIMCSMIEDIDKNANVTSLLSSLAAKIKNC